MAAEGVITPFSSWSRPPWIRLSCQRHSKRADTMVRNSQHERTDSEYILRQRQPPERPASKQRRIDANNIAPLKVINMPVPKKFSEQRKKATW